MTAIQSIPAFRSGPVGTAVGSAVGSRPDSFPYPKHASHHHYSRPSFLNVRPPSLQPVSHLPTPISTEGFVRPAFPKVSYSYPPLVSRPGPAYGALQPFAASARIGSAVESGQGETPASGVTVPTLPTSVSCDSSIHRGILRDVLIFAAFSVVECICSAHDIPHGNNLRAFITSIVKSSRTTSSILRVALYYLIRARDSLPTLRQTISSGRRLFLAALILAFKYLHDKTFSTRGWSKISEYAVSEINLYETSLLNVLDWRLHVPVELFEQWDKFLYQYRPTLMHCLQYHATPRAQQYLNQWNCAIMSLSPSLENLPQPSHLMQAAIPDRYTPALPAAMTVDSVSPARMSRVTPVPATGSLALSPEVKPTVWPTPSATPLSTRKFSSPGQVSNVSAAIPVSLPTRSSLQMSYTADHPPSSDSYPESIPGRRSAGWSSVSPPSSVFDGASSGGSASSGSSLDFSYPPRRDSTGGNAKSFATSYESTLQPRIVDNSQDRPMVCATLSDTPEALHDDMSIVTPLKQQPMYVPQTETRKRRRSSTGDAFGSLRLDVPAEKAWNNSPYTPVSTGHRYHRAEPFRHPVPAFAGHRYSVPYGTSPRPMSGHHPQLVAMACEN